MHERFAIRSRHPADFLSAKGLLVEFDGLTGTLHDQVRGQRVIAIRNRFDTICDSSFLSVVCVVMFCLSLRSILQSTGFSRLRSSEKSPSSA